MKAYSIFLLLIVSLLFMQCAKSGGEEVLADKSQERAVSEMDSQSNENDLLSSPDWAKDATIYEVNLRQYTEEGTFKSFLPHIPRLKDMGIDILCFLPINPISKNSQDKFNDVYLVQDFTAVNSSEHGSLAEFKAMVKEIHRAGMKIILDFEPYFTRNDHQWAREHPEYYINKPTKYPASKTVGLNGDTIEFHEVCVLDLKNTNTKKALCQALKWWLTECDIDGFKISENPTAPIDFWQPCFKEMKQVKNIFLLSNSGNQELISESNFSAVYGNGLLQVMNEIASGKSNAIEIESWYKNKRFSAKGFQVSYTSSYLQNSYEGTEFDRLAEGHQAFAILAGTLDGMPLVYSGQEEPLRRGLSPYEKDPIGFKNYAYADFYRTLLHLKKKNQALRNGRAGGVATFWNTNNGDVIAYSREKNGDIIFVVINLSPKQQSINLSTNGIEGAYNNVFSSSTTSLSSRSKFNLQPWDYLVLSKS